MSYKSINLLGYSIFSDSLEKINIFSNDKLVINTINPHSYAVSKNDVLFRNAIRESNIILPDGIGIVYAISIINNIKIVRITGYDLLIHFLSLMNNVNGRCFFLGTNNEILLGIKRRLNIDFPKIKFGSYAPPYTETFRKIENKKIIDKVNTFKPDILFISLSAPKQEKWIHNCKKLINTKVICGIGAAFNFYAEPASRPSQFWINRDLEWLIRFLRSPIKHWKRNILSLPIFIIDVIKAKLIYKI